MKKMLMMVLMIVALVGFVDVANAVEVADGSCLMATEDPCVFDTRACEGLEFVCLTLNEDGIWMLGINWEDCDSENVIQIDENGFVTVFEDGCGATPNDSPTWGALKTLYR